MMKVLTMQEFETEVLAGVKEHFPDDEVVIENVMKPNNVSYRGLHVKKDISAVVDLEKLYQGYCLEDSLPTVINKVMSILSSNSQLPEGIDISIVTHYDEVKELLIPYVMDSERNMEVIKEHDYVTIPYMDMSIGFMIYYEEAQANIKVTQRLMNNWEGIQADDLLAQATKNIQAKYKFGCMDSLMDIMALEMEEHGEVPDDMSFFSDSPFSACQDGVMFVLTNSTPQYGAAQMLNTELLGQIREHMGVDFFILPSSIHEIILVKCTAQTKDAEELKKIVTEINDTQVWPEELLTYSVYKYSHNSKSVSKVA